MELWIDIEEGDQDQPANRQVQNFCNIAVEVDGTRYALNIWTFDFLPLARREWPYDESAEQALASYLLPPDLFVERLDRPTIEAAIADLIANQQMRDEWISPG